LSKRGGIRRRRGAPRTLLHRSAVPEGDPHVHGRRVACAVCGDGRLAGGSDPAARRRLLGGGAHARRERRGALRERARAARRAPRAAPGPRRRRAVGRRAADRHHCKPHPDLRCRRFAERRDGGRDRPVRARALTRRLEKSTTKDTKFTKKTTRTYQNLRVPRGLRGGFFVAIPWPPWQLVASAYTHRMVARAEWDVIGIGANSVDSVYRLPAYPQPGGAYAKMRI